MKKRPLSTVLDIRRRRAMPNLRRRALFLFGGILIGVAAVCMALLADRTQMLFAMVRTRYPYLPILLTPLGFGLSAFLASRFFDGSQGSGIPQIMAARRLADQTERGRLASVRVAIGKIALLGLGLGVGASAGREGPTVQVGAAIMFALGRFAPHRQPGLLLAGASAGVAAAFNAPLAGIMFGIEEMSRSFEVRSSVLVLATVIAAGLTSQAMLGNYTYFGVATNSLTWGWQWVAVALAAVVGGLAGGTFSRCVVLFSDGLPGRIGRAIKSHPVLFAVLCGLLVATCGLAADGSIFGTGYEESKLILAGQPVPGLFGPLKWLATMLTAISSIPGGIFSPSLSVGAGLAANFAPLLPEVPINVLAILFMAAYLAGVVQAPLTSAIIVSEMTADHALILPIMISALTATVISKTICREGIYHALAAKFTQGKAVLERQI